MKKLNGLVLLTIVLCFATGCKKNELQDTKNAYNVSCVLGIANNNPVIKAENIEEISSLSQAPGSTYTCILASGNPEIISQGEIPDFSDKGYTKKMLRNVRKSIQADINQQIDNAVPKNPQVDIEAAITLGLRTLHANHKENEKDTLVLYMSGISTTGMINMINTSISNVDIETSLEKIRENISWDMSGTDIVWYCCGDVSGQDQGELSDNEKTKLKQFYEELFKGMGAKSVTFKEDIPLDESYHFDQPVSAMQTENMISLLQERIVESESLESDSSVAEVFAEGDVISFSDESIAFKPDSTELADEASAKLALTYVIDYMNDNPDFNVLIAGTTTSAGEADSCKDFSERRGETVKNLLMKEGINEERIHVIGLGYSSEFYISDRNEDGTLDESVAPSNRTVKLIDMSSSIAERLCTNN